MFQGGQDSAESDDFGGVQAKKLPSYVAKSSWLLFRFRLLGIPWDRKIVLELGAAWRLQSFPVSA